jgi:predicted MFS family arabinose efflux permease
MDGFRYLKGTTAVLILVSLYALPLLAQNTFLNFLPVFANEIWDVGAVGYGYLQGAPGLGAVVSLFILGLLTYYKNKFSLLIGSGLILATSLLIFPASPWFPFALFLTVAVGGMVTAFVAVETTLIQSIIPDQVRGRVLSWREVLFGLGPTGSILFGAIAQYTGVPISLALAGGICLFVSLLLILLFPRFRGTG